jgi:DnaJ-domain-containing protein 1
MDLPGRLRSTTLGDLLGALHRAGATGTLELAEDRGRLHRIYVAAGRVAAVELDGATPSLAEILRADRAADDDVLRRSLLRAMTSSRLHGEVLVDDFRLSPEVVGNALRRQVMARLASLEALGDARVSFRVAVRPPRSALAWGAATASREDGGDRARWTAALHPSEFLHGRRRRRDREGAVGGSRAPDPGGAAWRVLGLPAGADVSEIKRAYRRLAKSLHPDLHPEATPEERHALQSRFAQVTDAYRVLVA